MWKFFGSLLSIEKRKLPELLNQLVKEVIHSVWFVSTEIKIDQFHSSVISRTFYKGFVFRTIFKLSLIIFTIINNEIKKTGMF